MALILKITMLTMIINLIVCMFNSSYKHTVGTPIAIIHVVIILTILMMLGPKI